MTSSDVASAIERHDVQAPHGVTVGPPEPDPPPASPWQLSDAAGPARAHEKVGVVHAIARDRVAQRANDVLLADHVVERARTVPAVQRGRGGHGEG
jgi:hypothetical protein